MINSWNDSESGDGKGPVDTHFSYLNIIMRTWVDGGRNITSPRELFLALTGDRDPTACIKNTTTKFIDVGVLPKPGSFDVHGRYGSKCKNKPNPKPCALDRTVYCTLQ